jgi:hypothetical protein
MFRQLAAFFPGADGAARATALFAVHPSELAALLELAWDQGRAFRSGVNGVHRPWLDALFSFNPPTAPVAARLGRLSNVRWDHLIYAYMIENTRIYEIFRRVVSEFLHGEKLGVPLSAGSQNWLHATEDLFYKDPPPFSITGVASHVRQDLRASRRNAYQRMFSMNLNHGTDDNNPYPYIKADVANTEFVTTFEEFLREVWVGMVNFAVLTGPRPIDNEKIANLATKLHDMLTSRRLSGNLSREEFFFVSMMSWFHLTVEFDVPIILDLKAPGGGAGPEQRLFKVAQLVGLPAHGLSHSYFDIASPLSVVLTAIETGQFNSAANTRLLYEPIAGSLEPEMRSIINHWSIITGRDVKAGKVATT